MTAAAIAERLQARPAGAGRWVAKCPSHSDKSPSLSIRQTRDGKTLLFCFAGCPTETVLASVGLQWSDLFPNCPATPRRPVDPKAVLRQSAERGLRAWAKRTGRKICDELLRRNKLVTAGENRLRRDLGNAGGWELLSLGYVGLTELEYLADLLDSHRPADWLRAYRFLRETR
ncbi:hypothetical protein MYX84_02100 [Acidobacteria bacterium AH-259-O06]|nr:hypothetical protein [Acidobacteria bacterium AH-259-O06]